MRESFPWYDGWWLSNFVRAREFIALNRPARLREFTATLAPLQTSRDFEATKLTAIISRQRGGAIRDLLHSMPRQQLELHELSSHGRFVVHDHPELNLLHAELAEAVGQIVGEEVEPSYTFLGLYNRNGVCEIHLDAPVSKWTLDFCIEQSATWPIAISDVVPWPEEFDYREGWQARIRDEAGLRFREITMAPGDSILFSGSSQWHFREPFLDATARAHCNLLFLHYIPAGMKIPSDYRRWESLFDVPGLSTVLQGPQ